MCFGVRDAIKLAGSHSASGPLTILGDLVHNEQVMDKLKSSGVRVEKDESRLNTEKVMITAHGASEKRIEKVRQLGHQVVEATCPLVKFAHKSIFKLVAKGYFPVIIGKRGHVEVNGLTEDLDSFTVIESRDEIFRIPENLPKIGVASQTTQPVTKVRDIVALIQEKFPDSEVEFIDTVCRPTKERQKAAEDLAQNCDVVLCIGGKDSNNTRQLKEKSIALGARAHHIQSPEDIRREWFRDNDVIGITAGTSTPLELVDAVEERLKELVSQINSRELLQA